MKTATCPTCCRSIGNPFRVYDRDGSVISGCIDDAHTGQLVTPSESAFWHNRPIAKKLRAWSKARLRAVLKGQPQPPMPCAR